MLMYIFYNLYHSIMIIIFNLRSFYSHGSTPEVLRPSPGFWDPPRGFGAPKKGSGKKGRTFTFHKLKVTVYFVK